MMIGAGSSGHSALTDAIKRLHSRPGLAASRVSTGGILTAVPAPVPGWRRAHLPIPCGARRADRSASWWLRPGPLALLFGVPCAAELVREDSALRHCSF